jgi:hypothetical protein
MGLLVVDSVDLGKLGCDGVETPSDRAEFVNDVGGVAGLHGLTFRSLALR